MTTSNIKVVGGTIQPLCWDCNMPLRSWHEYHPFIYCLFYQADINPRKLKIQKLIKLIEAHKHHLFKT